MVSLDGVIKRTRSKYRARRGEWISAARSILFGVALLLPGSADVYNTNVVFSALRVYTDASTLGYIMIVLGLLRVAALVINGARKNVTPWIRVFTGLLGFGAFTFVSLALAASGIWSIWIAAWPLAAIGELYNIHDAMRDARAKNG